MSSPATYDWMVGALKDIARRLSATGQHDGENAVARAAAVVQQTSGARSECGPPAPLTTAPMIEGNIRRERNSGRTFSGREALRLLVSIRTSTHDQLPNVLGENRMIAAPTMQIAAPVRSQLSGRCISTAQSQMSEAAMNTPPLGLYARPAKSDGARVSSQAKKARLTKAGMSQRALARCRI